MQKKEFFGVLLLVSLVSSIMFAGLIWAPVVPSISVYPATGITASSDVYIRVTGAGWAYAPVTLYWDQQTDNHVIAIMTPSTYGSFRLDQLEIESVPIGLHTIIAVQGLSVATATYTVTATLPPDDRLLSPIQQIENKLDNATFGLPGIQSNLTKIMGNMEVLPRMFSGEYDYQHDISAEQNVSSARVVGGIGVRVAKFMITYWAYSNVSTVTARIYLLLPGGDTRLLDETPINNPSVQFNFYASREFECNSEGILLTLAPSAPARVDMQWYITVEHPEALNSVINIWP